MTSRWIALALLLPAVVLAAWLRLAELGARPMHGDEAVHAWKLIDLWQRGEYAYDPHEYHGPTLNYATLPVVWMSGTSSPAALRESHLRLAPALAGIALVPLLWLLSDGMPRGALFGAAMFTAVSPALVFYSRYYIQESLLVLFAMVVLGAAWRYHVSHRIGWAVLCGAGAGLMHATKETCAINFAAGALALAVVWRCAPQPAARRTPAPHGALTRGMLAAVVAALLTSGLLFSSFLSHPRGPLDSLLTYGTYLSRGVGDEGLHRHPWHYYLSLLAWADMGRGPWMPELPLLGLASVGVAGACRCASRLRRFVAVYTVLQVVIYSTLPYKTPWSILSSVHGAALLAGWGASDLSRCVASLAGPGWARRALRASCAVGIAAGVLWQARAAYALSREPRVVASQQNPFVYAHPVADIRNLEVRVQELMTAAPQAVDQPMVVIHANPWPLPWLLRSAPQVGYWDTIADVPPALLERASIIVLDARQQPAAALLESHVASIYGLRPQEHLLLLVRRDAWEAFLQRPAAQPVTGGGPP